MALLFSSTTVQASREVASSIVVHPRRLLLPIRKRTHRDPAVLVFQDMGKLMLGRFRGDFLVYTEGLHHGQATHSGLPA